MVPISVVVRTCDPSDAVNKEIVEPLDMPRARGNLQMCSLDTRSGYVEAMSLKSRKDMAAFDTSVSIVACNNALIPLNIAHGNGSDMTSDLNLEFLTKLGLG